MQHQLQSLAQHLVHKGKEGGCQSLTNEQLPLTWEATGLQGLSGPRQKSQ